jgi:hypothetical protein
MRRALARLMRLIRLYATVVITPCRILQHLFSSRRRMAAIILPATPGTDFALGYYNAT